MIKKYKTIALCGRLTEVQFSNFARLIRDKLGREYQVVNVGRPFKVKDITTKLWDVGLCFDSGMLDNLIHFNHYQPTHKRGEVFRNEHGVYFINALFDNSIFFDAIARIEFEQLINKIKWVLSGKYTSRFLYKPIYTVGEMETFYNWLSQFKEPLLIASDIETSMHTITCISYAVLVNPKLKLIMNVCIALAIPQSNQSPDDYLERLRWINKINALNHRWIYHNGSYDVSWLCAFGCPPKTYQYDNQYLFYSTQIGARKNLAFTSRCNNPQYRYWKEEIKGGEKKVSTSDKESNDEVKGGKMPKTKEGYERYLRYCALDSYYTLTNFWIQLCEYVAPPSGDYIVKNYSIVFPLEKFYMKICNYGLVINKAELRDILYEKKKKAMKYKWLLHYLLGPSFNPNSPKQMGWLYFDLLKATPVNQSKSTNHEARVLMSPQHPLIDLIGTILDGYSKANKYVSDFQSMLSYDSITRSRLSSTGTVTGRASSSGTHFGTGRNMQNITSEIRECMHASSDSNMIFDIDYAQADLYFVAHESQDIVFIKTVTGDKDVHSLHASRIFKVYYEEAMAGKKDKQGYRTLSKPISHGVSNFMKKNTFYKYLIVIYGLAATKKLATNLGFKDHSPKGLLAAADYALQAYRNQYPTFTQWPSQIARDWRKGKGVISNCHGFTRYFPFDPLTNDTSLKEIGSFLSQGGTGGMINQALLRFMKSDLWERGMKIYFQVHDSVVGECPKDKPELLDEFLTMLEHPIQCRGRTFVCPADAELMLQWSKKNTVPYHRGGEVTVDKLKPE